MPWTSRTMSGNYRVFKGRACTLGYICEGPEGCCALESTRIMAVWMASITDTKASVWQWVTTQSEEGKQEVTNSDPMSTGMAEVHEEYSWQVKPPGNPGRKAKPMRCRENEQCYRGAPPLATNHRNVVPALRINFTNIPFTQQSGPCPKPSSASVPPLPEHMLPSVPQIGN